VHHANLFDRVEKTTGIEPFGRLVEQVMTSEPYAVARTVYWIVDHASWLNQIELYFSILQRKALTPNDLPTLEAVAERVLGFGEQYPQIARPFEWTFTRQKLNELVDRIDRHEPQLALAA
jgi:hypothetical protein